MRRGSASLANALNKAMWIMMQVAMRLCFATSYPVNWWLLKKGIKEAM
ncbi:MAG TPA: DUF4396 domain-containing protein [Candidatus Sulfotelmatobacter sp.]|nr:DUF4396 domain-containing protein [Candidatus Sulfotelmatobacter sp.]